MSNLFTFCGLYCGDCPELAKAARAVSRVRRIIPVQSAPARSKNPLRIAVSALLFPATNSMPWLTTKNWAPMANCWTP